MLYTRGSDGKLHPIPALVGPQGPAGADGAPGAPGADGYTPVKGTDYFTPDDQAAMVQAVIAALPKYGGEVV